MTFSAEKTGHSVEKLLEDGKQFIPARRFGSPDEFGALCAFLCSTHASYITGQNILIDGGLVSLSP